MPNFIKKIMVDELGASLRENNSFIVTGYSGLTSNELNELRSALRGAGGRFRVVKNRPARIVMQEKPLCSLLEYLEGPTGFVMVAADDLLAPLKVLTEFAAGHAGLELRGGLIESAVVGKEEIREISSLPGREQLVAQLMGGLAAPITNFIRVIDNPISAFVRSLEKIREKLGGESDGR